MRTPDPLSRRRFMQSTTTALAAATVASPWLIGSNVLAADAPTTIAAGSGKKLGFAFVGLGRFATNQLMPDIAKSQHCRIAALVSGDPAKAKKLAAQYGVAERSVYSYETFDRIKDDAGVDVVYVVLPNGMHAEYTVRAANAGKHVMCEKPMANTVEECQQMIDACKKNDRKLMIGYRLQFQPHHLEAIRICREKQHGALRMINADHSFNIGRNEWRTKMKLAGGGPLMDVGIYCLQACRYLTGEEPTHVTAQTWRPTDDPRFKEVEASMVFSLKFPSGAMGNCTTSYAHQSVSRLGAMLEQGVLEMNSAFGYGGQQLTVRAKGARPQPLDIQGNNQFAAEMDHFAQCILENRTPRCPGEDGLQDVKIMRKLYEAAEQGKTLEV